MNNTIVLIQPHCSFAVNESPFYELFDSIGLLSIQKYLMGNGYDVKYFHIPKLRTLHYTKEDIYNLLRKQEPIVFGIGLMWLHQSLGAIEICQMIKKINEKNIIVVGGQQASLFHEDIMKKYSHLIDCVVLGEGEYTFLDIIKSIENSGSIEQSTKGICILDNNNIVKNKRCVDFDIKELSYIDDKNIYPKSKLFNYENKIPRTANLMTMRGNCAFKCNYCLQSSKIENLRRKTVDFYPVEYLVEQIKVFIKNKKTRLSIADSFLSNKPENILHFIELLNKENIQLEQIHIFCEPGYSDRSIFRELKKLPSDHIAIDYGIETGSAKVARNMGRIDDLDYIMKDIEELGKHGFISTAWWLFNLPGETIDDIKQTKSMISYTISNNVYVERISPLILFPHTETYHNAKKFGIIPKFHHFDDFMRFSTQERKEDGVYPDLITHTSEHFNLEELIEVQNDLFAFINHYQTGKPIQLKPNNIF